MSLIKKLSIGLVLLFFFIEIFSFIFSKLELIPFNNTPLAYSGFVPDGNGNFWRTEDKDWGSWHKSNYRDRHRGACYDVIYETNSLGARDDEFDENPNNIILLGDSFAEGYAVSKEDSSAWLIEKKLEFKVNNLGVAAHVGPLQYWLIYKNFRETVPHNKLIVYFLPENDFQDNDYNVWEEANWLKRSNEIRHRPYWKEAENQKYTYFYPEGSVKASDFNRYAKNSIESKVKRFLGNFLWTANVFRTIHHAQKKNKFQKIHHEGKPEDINLIRSGYLDSPLYQQKANIFFLKKIFDLAEDKQIYLVIIPVKQDYEKIENDDYKNQYWYKSLFEISNNNESLFILDLLDLYKNENHNDYFLECDGHWNYHGNQMAADAIINLINTKN